MSRQMHTGRGRLGDRLIVAWLATLILTGHAMADQSFPGKHATFNVTDRGIGQKEELRLNAGEPRHWTMSTVDPQARLAIIMPNESQFNLVSTETLRQEIFQTLKTQVSQRMEAGLTEFEIQLVQDINLPGYTNLGPDNRQGMVDRFGAAAYGAITDLNRYLRENGVQVTNRAIVGSNGAKVFVANIPAWQLGGQSIWHSVDFFDGRSYLTPTVEAIRKIGASRVRIFNTTGDLWAPFFPWGLSSIASRSTARHIKDHYFPEVNVYQLSPLTKLPDGSHISGMTDSHSFKVTEYKGFAEGVQQVAGKYSGLALRQSLPPSVARSLPQDQQESIAMWRTTVKDFVDIMKESVDYSRTAHDPDHPLTTSLKGAHGGYRLVAAMMKDLEGDGDQDLVLLSSNTVEELITYTLDQMHETDLARTPKSKLLFRQLDAYKEFFSGGMEVWRTQTLNADAVTKIDRGVIEVVKREWREQSPQLNAARWQVSKSEREVHAAQQALENTQRQLKRWAKNPTMLRTQETKVQNLVETLNNRKEALAVAKSSEQVLLARLMFLDVLPELAGGLTEHASEGHLTVKVADRYSDALVLLSSAAAATTCAATVVCAPYAPIVRELVITAEHATIDSNPMKVAAQNIHNFFAQDKFTILEQYQTYLARAIRTGETVKTLRQYAGDTELTQVGFTEEEKDGQDAIALQHNLRHDRSSTPTPDPHAAPPPQIHAKDPKIGSVLHDCAPGQFCPPPDTKNTLAPCGVGGTSPCRQSGPPARHNGPPDRGPGAGAHRTPLAPDQSGSTSPLASSTASDRDKPLGGIDLNIQSIVVDSNSGTIAVLTKNGNKADADIAAKDLAFAIWLTYTGQQAAFSLDPANPKDPSGKWLKAVYYPDTLRGTAAGRDLFDADFLLKQFAFGVRVEGDQVIERHTATSLKSIPQLMDKATTDRTTGAQWARMWIVVPRVDLRVTNGMATVAAIQMAVRARRQVPDPSAQTGLRDVDTDDGSVESQFARQFSELYTELGRVEAPSLLRVRELAKAIACAQWMKQQHIAVDMKQVADVLNQDRVEAIDRITALSVDWQHQTQERVTLTNGTGIRTTTRTVHIFGGVDLTIKPTMTKSSASNNLQQAVLSKLSLARSAHFSVEHEGHRYQAFVMPFRMANR